MAKVEHECGNILGCCVGEANGTVQGDIAGSVTGEGGLIVEKSIQEARSTEVPSSEPDASTVPPNQLTIFFGGRVTVFEGLPAEKVQEIIHIAAAAAAAKSIETKNSTSASPVQSPALDRAPSFSSTSIASPATQSFSMQPISFCRSAADLPIARRHSLQRFLEKRRDRLVNKNPYPVSDMKKTDSPSIKEEHPTA